MPMLMMGCSQTDIPLIKERHFDEIKGIIMEPISRTIMGSDGSVLWEAEDCISVFLSTGFHHKYILTEGQKTASGKFTFSESISDSPKQTSHYAVYPFNESNSLNAEGKISVNISSWANQTYSENSLEIDNAFMTGKSTNTNFAFYNATSMARFELSSNVPGSFSISSISLSSDSKFLNGNGSIDMTKDKPLIECIGSEETNKMNTLTCAKSVILTEQPTYFYILVPPADYSDLKITIRGTDELNGTDLLWEKTLEQTTTFERSKYKRIEKIFKASDFSGNIESD